MSEVTFRQINDKMATKQKQLSIKRSERPEARRKYEESKRMLKSEYKRIWLLIKLHQSNITIGELKTLTDGSDEYQQAWAKHIVEQCEYEKLKTEIQNLESELDTLHEIGINLKRESDAGKY